MSTPAHLLSDKQLLDVFALTKTATAIHVGEDAVIQTANDAMLAIWGKDKSVIGKSLEEALPELKGQPFIDMFKKVWNECLIVSGTDTPADLIIDGVQKTFYFDFEYRAVPKPNGKTLCIIHTAIDVTERVFNREALAAAREKQEALEREQAINEELAASNEELAATNEELAATNEELHETQDRLNELNLQLEERVERRVVELLESEERFRTMAEATDILIALADETKNAVYFNEAWVNLTGRSREQLIKFGWRDMIHPDDKEEFVNGYLQAFEERLPYKRELRVMDKDGNYRWLMARIPPRFRPDGSFAGYISSAFDITDRKKAEQEIDVISKKIASANEQLRLAISTAALGTWRADLSNGTLFVSERGRTIHGLTSDEQLTLEESLQMVHPDDRDRVAEVIAKAVEEQGDFEHEYRIQPRDGRPMKWLRSTGKIFANDNGELHITGTIFDNTERKENELRKNDFIGMVSHELKTPLTSLTAIVQLSHLKLLDNDDDFLRTAMDKANNQVKKMTNMINGFLSISRLESGKFLIEKRNFNMGELIEEMISEIKLTISERSITLSACDDAIIFADRDKIGSVISNLLSNAVKYSLPDTTIEVGCAQHDGEITVSIRDHGMGIQKEEIKKLFERYYRVESSNTQHISGFGIGLYLSSEIVARHGGKIWAESEPGKGSTFYFMLPNALEFR